MITTTIKLINTHHLLSYLFLVKMLKIYSLSKFQVYITVLLTIVTMLDIRSSKLIHLNNQKFLHLDKHLLILTHCQQPLMTTILLTVSKSSAFLFLKISHVSDTRR